ncbi:MAG: cation:proton antiporter [Sandaracinaceae bacterium]
MHEAHFVADIAIVLGVGAVIAVLARRLGQPTILGYLFAGLIVGPYLPVPIFADVERTTALAEFGVVLVMFAVGLEFRIAKLFRVLPTAGLTGLIQVSFLIFAGFSVGRLLGWDLVASLFLGACVCISSTMVVSKVFAQKKVPADVRELVLGILVIQDVIAIVLIAAMTGVAAGGGMAPAALALTLAKLAGVLIAMLGGGMLVVPRLMKRIARFESVELDAVVAIGLCFALALLAESLGYSVALGAFIGGILVAESGLGERIERLIQPVRDMFAAIFFVSIGMTVDPLEAWANLPLALLVFAVVVVGQLLSVGFSGLLAGNGLRRSVTAGLSLGQIGEFAFILAAIGIGADVVPESLQPILVTVAVLTAFTTPLAIGVSSRVVHALDAAMPRRLQSLISLHEEWLERLRAGGSAVAAPTRRAMRNLVVDSVALLLLLVLAAVLAPAAPARVAGWSGMSEEAARIAVTLAALLVAVPFLVGVARNAVRYARLRSGRLLGRANASTPSAEVGSRALGGMILALIVLALGVPFTAALGFVVGVGYAALGFGVGIIVVSIHLWRTAGRVDTEFGTAVLRIGDALSTHPYESPPSAHLSTPGLISGLDDVVTFTVSEKSAAAGKTLAQLDLRARTGATVIAVRRGEHSATLPAGDQSLEPGDLLALTGTQAAVDSAQSILRDGVLPDRADDEG